MSNSVGDVMGVLPQAMGSSLNGCRDLFFDPIILANDVIRNLGSQDSSQWQSFYDGAVEAKNITGFPVALLAADNLKDNVVVVAQGTDRPSYYASQIVGNLGDLTKGSCEGMKFLNHRNIVSLGDGAQDMLGNVASGAMLTSGVAYGGAAIADIVDSNKALSDPLLDDDDKAFEQMRSNSSWIAVAKCISYIACAALVLTAAIFGVVFSPWITLTASAASLLLTISQYFYDRLSGYQALRV